MARVLIVDDDHIVRDLLHATLDFGEHEIVEAPDGSAALEALAARPPDVVILDLDLPGAMSGLDVLAKLDPRVARVIVLTGSGRAREDAARKGGAVEYLTKPFSPLALIQRIEAALAAGGTS